MNADDTAMVEALADLCPSTDGLVVYSARGLYNVLHNDNRIFDDNCIDADSAARHANDGGHTIQQAVGAEGIAGQQYSLYPNPNDGNLTLLQAQTDKQPVQAEILTAIGSRIDGQMLHFNQNITRLHLANIIPGLYLLKLTDSYGKVYNLKFVVE